MWPVPSPEHREVLAEISALAPSTKQIFVTSQHKERARPEERQPDLPQKTIIIVFDPYLFALSHSADTHSTCSKPRSPGLHPQGGDSRAGRRSSPSAMPSVSRFGAPAQGCGAVRAGPEGHRGDQRLQHLSRKKG